MLLRLILEKNMKAFVPSSLFNVHDEIDLTFSLTEGWVFACLGIEPIALSGFSTVTKGVDIDVTSSVGVDVSWPFALTSVQNPTQHDNSRDDINSFCLDGLSSNLFGRENGVSCDKNKHVFRCHVKGNLFPKNSGKRLKSVDTRRG